MEYAQPVSRMILSGLSLLNEIGPNGMVLIKIRTALESRTLVSSDISISLLLLFKSNEYEH